MTGLPPALAAELARLGGQLGDIQRRITSLERGQAAATLGLSSIEADGLVINDDNGVPQLILGQQADGTFAQLAVNAGPPPQCSDPLVGATIAGLMVSWDGHMADGSPPLSDFAGVQVHCAGQPGFVPGPATLQSTLLGPGLRPVVGLQPGTIYYVIFVTINAAGQTGPPSSYITGVPLSVPQAIPPGSITPSMVSFSVTGGGAQVTFSATAPASPNTGDLWYDAANGYRLSQWNGSAWTPYTFGTSAITAGSITASLLAAGSVTAAKIAAGTIISGIVDTTTIIAPLLIGSQVLAYATTTPRGPVFYDFETTVQGWTALASGAVSQSAAWASSGAGSLLLTAAGGGSPAAVSPAGTSGIPVLAGDPVALTADLQAPVAVSNGYVGIRWYTTGGVFISETDCPDAVLAAGVTTTLQVTDVAPAPGFAALCYGNHGTLTAGTLIYGDNILISGNLVYSTSPSGGTDSVGNIYSQGLEVAGLPGMKSVISVTDPWNQNTLLAIDPGGNVSGQLGTFSDVSIGGSDFLAQILPSLPAGLVARSSVFASSLPAPGTPTTATFYLYELDVQMTAGREMLLVIEPIGLAISAGGKVRVTVYGTTDGTQPTSSSPVVCQYDYVFSGTVTAGLNVRTGTIAHPLSSASGNLWRFLVALDSFSTGSGAPTIQVTQIGSGQPGDEAYTNAQARFSVYDMGPTVANSGRQILATAGGSGGGTRNYVTTWQASHSYCYQGSDGGNPNVRIDTDGKMYTGGDYGDTYNGKAKTWIIFPGSLASTLSGATITQVEIYLNNNHTWYGSGMNVGIGWDNKISWGSTSGDPSGSGVDITDPHFNQGQAKWVTVPNSVGNNLASGAATSVVLFRNSNNLQYYGTFAGASQSGGPAIRVHYSK